MLTIGRFEIVEKLGQGAFGIVYRAHDPTLDREVAIKLFPAATPDEIAEIWREARALARFSHPNIVQVFDVGIENGNCYVVMELIHGETGHEFITVWTDWRLAVEVYEQAGTGLAIAHDRGLVHGDFKPVNVFLGFDGRVCIGDFGLATPREDARKFAGGTVEYMAPERLLGRPPDHWSDQWSFCVSLWETLHGRRPFAGHEPFELIAAIHRGLPAPDPDSGIPVEVEAVLRVGLANEAEDRYPSMWALLVELRRLREPANEPARFRGVFFMGLALACVGVLGLLGGVEIGRRTAEGDRQAIAEVEVVGDPVVRLVVELIAAGKLEDANAIWEGEIARRGALGISIHADSLRIADAFEDKAAELERVDRDAAETARNRAEFWRRLVKTLR